ncbi:flagellar biosynthesis protein FlgA [Nocardioides pocheonensis]|uniref:Flagellar biosynthesis protein FlgA n=1 Tax=Nocardioides pocheonensis TaxID=661485 RepID=A0A3N0GN69_9ACTN|nr:flagellar biosynthesis protein FlgA [Nocardioides pocheonensis]RNM13608.1 flagellar biosynthesis protein FlgA [Nocardioides pocheonensis]
MSTMRTVPVSSEARPTSPPAVRAQTAGWRDPRLVVGVVIVAVCVLVGARVLAGADDTVAVWSLRHDVAAGATLGAGDLVPVRVHFAGDGAGHYLPAGSGPAPGGVAAHDLTAGELLPRSGLASESRAALVEVPLSVAPDDLPASVGRGAVVDVWVTPKVAAAGDERVRARLALDDVVVLAVPESGDGLAPSTTQQVIVGVDAAQAHGPDAELADALGQLADGRVVITRQAS